MSRAGRLNVWGSGVLSRDNGPPDAAVLNRETMEDVEQRQRPARFGVMLWLL